MRVLGINAVFHDPAAALVVDGRIVAAAEEERFTRRKHGKPCVPFSTWELPEHAARWALRYGNVSPDRLDAVAYSYDPDLAPADGAELHDNEYEALRTYFVRRAPGFLATLLPGLDRAKVRFVPHHVAHAASAYLAGPHRDCAVMVLDGRGEQTSYLAGVVRGGELEVLRRVALPHSLGLRYEELTMHVGFQRSSDEYKVMALASYGRPHWRDELRAAMHADGDGGFIASPVDFARFVPPRAEGEPFADGHADLAASLQAALQETMLELARWLHERSGMRALVMAGGVALNVVANAYLAEHGPFDDVWVQPAAGDAGTALGAALYVAREMGDEIQPMGSAALGRGWSDAEIEGWLRTAHVPYTRPPDIADAVAEVIERDGVVAWFQGRSEYGPRALGHRSLLANPRHAATLHRLNDVKGREQFRPVAPMTLLERAPRIFEGTFPSPYMLFVHTVKPEWTDKLQAVVHVDGTARVQTVDPAEEPLVARMLEAVERRTGVPVVVNTSLNTAGRPMVDDPRDALECFGSAPVDAMAIGPFLLARNGFSAGGNGA
ncbi:MAG TPA: carbamoyltransferase C-terminal domain-containing protein [Candidatus Limnocylindria bacterium]|jgi:carbamoyltransferase|nr:carbamoyltransferase C-terminal domain-containing protein [Candidatus Limnocylindria bacterium]